MKKVRITKEQLETIVESTLNAENTEVVAEETVNEEVLEEGFEPEIIMQFFNHLISGEWIDVIKYMNQFATIQEMIGFLTGTGLVGTMLGVIKYKVNKYFKENPEAAAKLKPEIRQDIEAGELEKK